MSDTIAAGQLRAFVERILRLKEEQDTLAADIRDVYAEAKGTGFDKTAMGQLVAHLRKVEKVGVSAVEEGQSIFDLYLSTYQRAIGTAVATHTHEASQSYAEVKGSGDVDPKLVETIVKGVQTEIGRKALVTALDAMIEAEEIPPHDPVTGEVTEQPETANEMDRATEGSFETGSEAAEKGRKAIPAGPEGADLSHAGADESSAADERSVEATVEQRSSATISDADVPAFLKKDHPVKTARDYRPHCQHPEACGASGLHHCYTCAKALAAESEAA